MSILKELEEVGRDNSVPFGPDTERAIVSLILDYPDIYVSLSKHLSHKYFRLNETKFVIQLIEKLYEKHGFVPSRELVRDHALKHFSVDDDWEPYLKTIERVSSPREVPFIKDELINWSKDAAYSLLYDDEAIMAFESKDYDKLQKIFDDAQKISDVSTKGLWFFDDLDGMFEKKLTPTFTCGFSKIDQSIEGGGPAKGEVFCFMAPTGVGKCHTLSSKIWEKKLSLISTLEIEIDGKIEIIKAAGFRKIKTSRGEIRICDLKEEDDIIELPIYQDQGDLLISTDRYQSLDFKEIFPVDLEEETPYESNDGYEVYTPSGWETVLGFYKTKPMKTVIITFNDNILECAEEHLVLTIDGLKHAKDCNNKLISTIDGYQQCKVEPGNIQNLYDLQIADPHIWYTSKIASHNSILLPHAGIANMKRGCNVLHITLELSDRKTQLRYAGAMSDIEIHNRFESKEKMLSRIKQFKQTYGGDLVIYDLPPDETSVTDIYAIIHRLRKQYNWNPDIVVIDYLEQLIPKGNTDSEYAKQKNVSTEIRGLARKENVLVFTATQTNRPDDGLKRKGPPGVGVDLIGVNKVAESFGKLMPMDYVISANQSEEERAGEIKTLRLFIAKNRNGARDVLCAVKVNYETMKMEQVTINKLTHQ